MKRFVIAAIALPAISFAGAASGQTQVQTQTQTSATTPAHLDAPPQEDEQEEEERKFVSYERRLAQFHISGGPGLSSEGIHFGAMALARIGVIAVGPMFSYSGLFSTKIGGGVGLGASTRGADRFGFDALGEFGVHSHHVAGGLLSDDPGATGTIPYAGGRVGVRWTLGNTTNRARPHVGVWLFVRQDLSSHTATYQYEEEGWFGGGRRMETGHATIGGQTEAGLAFRAGFDVTP